MNVLFLGDRSIFPFEEFKNLRVMDTMSNSKDVYDVLLVQFDEKTFSSVVEKTKDVIFK